MIRASRRHLVRTQADLAAAAGVSVGRFRNAKMHHRPGHPEPITSPGSRTLLWDGQQTDAFYAGQDVPDLPAQDHEDDLLDRNEAAELVGVKAPTWNRYANLPGIERRPDAAATVAGIDHWRRRDVLAWKAARPGLGTGGGRPKGSADLVPVEEIQPRAAQLLATDPALGAGEAAERIGVAEATARRALAAARADAVDGLLQQTPHASAEDIRDRLGFPDWAVQRALHAVAARQRAERARPYLSGVRAELDAAGVDVGDLVIRVRPGKVVAAVLELGPGAPSRLLVWDERYGWRTAPQRPNLGRAETTPPQSPGVRYLGDNLTPAAADLAAQLADRRSGRRRPLMMGHTATGGEELPAG